MESFAAIAVIFLIVLFEYILLTGEGGEDD